MSLTVPTKYIKFLVDNNDTISLFLETTAQQSQKSAQVYGMGLSHFARFLQQLGDIKNRKYPKPSYTPDEIIEALKKQ
jgi:hypothetical protein